MKAVRILQVVALVLLLAYFLLLEAANPTLVNLPFLLPISPALALAIALLLGWLIGWIPARIASWRRKREISRLEKHIAQLEQHLPSYDKQPVGTTPVIPDRMPRAEEHLSSQRGE